MSLRGQSLDDTFQCNYLCSGLKSSGDRDNYEVSKVHLDNLYRMVQYCENSVDCRRVQLLNYFGETTYSKEKCLQNRSTACDNCLSGVRAGFSIFLIQGPDYCYREERETCAMCGSR